VQALWPNALLSQLSGYSHNSLIMYLRALREKGFPVGAECRVARRKAFDLTVDNPVEHKRRKALVTFKKRKSVVEQWKAYSWGQFLMAQMVRLLTGARVAENGAPSCLENHETGGCMEYDVLLDKHDTALEFQGPQHYRTTRLFPSEEKLRARRERDQLKRKLSAEAGITLIEVFAHDLSFERLAALLQAAGVPIRPIPDEKRYVYQALYRHAERYRAAAARGEVV